MQEKQDGAARTEKSKQNQSTDDSKKGQTPPSEAETIENIQKEVSRLKPAAQLEEKSGLKAGLKPAVFVSHLSDSETTIFPPDASRENGGENARTTDPVRFEPSESIDLGKLHLWIFKCWRFFISFNQVDAVGTGTRDLVITINVPVPVVPMARVMDFPTSKSFQSKRHIKNRYIGYFM